VGELGMKEIWMRRTENKSEKRILEFWFEKKKKRTMRKELVWWIISLIANEFGINT
jgi:hypothetical protein